MLSLVLLAIAGAAPAFAVVGSSYPVQTKSIVTTYTYAPASDPGAPAATAVAGLSTPGNPDVSSHLPFQI